MRAAGVRNFRSHKNCFCPIWVQGSLHGDWGSWRAQNLAIAELWGVSSLFWLWGCRGTFFGIGDKSNEPRVACEVNNLFSLSWHEFVDDANITRDAANRCQEKGEGRMRLQLQSKKYTPWSRLIRHPDPPGVLFAEVDAALDALYTQAPLDVPDFNNKNLRERLEAAVDKVRSCAEQIRTNGGILVKDTVCQAWVQGTKWRIDLENLNGWNLQQ